MKSSLELRAIGFRALTFLVVGFLSAEVIVRIYLSGFAEASVFNRYASLRALEERHGAGFLGVKTRYAPHRYLGYYPTPNFSAENGDRHNALGFRGKEIVVPKPHGVFRIVALGGSTTYGFGVGHYEQSFPHQLERLLRGRGYPQVEVVNAGAASYSSWESLVNLEFRVLDLEPNLILVYHATNDSALRLVWPPSAHRGDNSGARGPWQGRAVSKPMLFETSAALRFAAVSTGWFPSGTALSEHWDKRAETFYSDEFWRQLRSGAYPDGVFREVPAEMMMAANGPIYYERNLRNIVAIADANRVGSVLATFAYSPSFLDEPRVSHPVYTSAMDANNQITIRIAQETGSHLYDFAAEMPKDETYFTDGRHFTEAGNALRAELFAKDLVDAGLIPNP